MRIITHVLLSVLIFTLFSCGNNEIIENGAYQNEQIDDQGFNSQQWVLNKGEVLSRDVKKYGELLVGVKHVSALKFIERTGQVVLEEDKESLKDESVFILEFKSLSAKERNPLNLPQCNLTFEEGIKHLSFDLENSITIEQGDSIFTANGSHFERDFSLSDRLRVIAFFKGINRNKEFNFSLNDEVFGGGKLNFRFANYLNYTENS